MWLPRQDKQTLTAAYISNAWTDILLPLAIDIRRCHFWLNRTLLTVSRLVSPGWIESMKRCQIPQREREKESADAHTHTHSHRPLMQANQIQRQKPQSFQLPWIH